MSSPGRPKSEFRSAKHEGTPMSSPGRPMKALLAALALWSLAPLTQAENGAPRSATLGKLRWATTSIPVCWETMAPSEELLRETVRQAIAMTWEKHSGLRTTGWQQCQPNEAAIRLNVQAGEWPRSYMGRQSLQSERPSMWLNFHIDAHPSFTGCKGRLQRCVLNISVHEFGHALGFVHEQDRPDTPADCDAKLSHDQINYERRASSDLVLLSAYDAQSRMNYCNRGSSFDDKPYEMSAGDIEGIQKLFGLPPAAPVAVVVTPPPPVVTPVPVVVTPPPPVVVVVVVAPPPPAASAPRANPLQPLVDLLKAR